MRISEAPIEQIGEVGDIPCGFMVDRVVEVDASGELRERTVAEPYLKDYDAIEGNRPADWAHRFDLSKWGLLFASIDGTRVGAAVLGFLDERTDVVTLWDLRVAPDLRGRGIGSALFDAAERWASDRGRVFLEIETQNNNAAACRLYARRGCGLVSVVANAYPELPGEAMLLWRKRTPSASEL